MRFTLLGPGRAQLRRRREIVLGRLNTLVKDFVVKVSMRLGMSELNAKDAGGKIFTFGPSCPTSPQGCADPRHRLVPAWRERSQRRH